MFVNHSGTSHVCLCYCRDATLSHSLVFVLFHSDGQEHIVTEISMLLLTPKTAQKLEQSVEIQLYLPHNKNMILSAVVTLNVDRLVPDSYQKYICIA